MNFPKLKYPRLCRLLTYLIVLGAGAIPIVAVYLIPCPDFIRVIVLLASLLGMLYYIVCHFVALMSMDICLAMLSCARTAKAKYFLPKRRTADKIRRSILRYGKGCQPVPTQPQPSALRYKFSNPLTIYSSGIERVVAAYEVDQLTPECYREIFRSAKANSKALTGKKKPLFLDKQQKKSPLHRVTVLMILAHRVDEKMKPDLYKLVCQNCGDAEKNCIVPCVVDLQECSCVFNCLREPYCGYGYAVKNRGIRIIKRRIFGNHWNLRHSEPLPPTLPLPATTLWELWSMCLQEAKIADRKEKKRAKSLSDQELIIDGDTLYLKHGKQCLCQLIKLDSKSKIARVESVTDWSYPATRPIGKKTIAELESRICAYLSGKGYRVEFVELTELMEEE